MNIEISKERETPLLSRKRITASLTFDGPTPSRKDIREKVAKKMDAPVELTIIKHVYPKYGDGDAKVIAHVYSKDEDKKKFESEYLLKKHAAEAPKEEPKAEEKPAEAPKAEEKPAEAKEAPKEEPKAEAPKEEPKAEELKAEEKPAEEAPKEEPKAEEKKEE